MLSQANIYPDHYLEYNYTQLIFDAKYYSKVVGINYKQVAYIFMLQNLIDTKTDKKKFLKTYSALILPSDKRSTKIHFSLDRKFGNNDIIITEEYLMIKDVMEEFLSY